MLKEIKYLIFIIIICFFLFFTGKYYFSDSNKKKSYRSLNNIDSKISFYLKKLPILEDDSKNVVEYIEQSNNKKKKKGRQVSFPGKGRRSCGGRREGKEGKPFRHRQTYACKLLSRLEPRQHPVGVRRI